MSSLPVHISSALTVDAAPTAVARPHGHILPVGAVLRADGTSAILQSAGSAQPASSLAETAAQKYDPTDIVVTDAFFEPGDATCIGFVFARHYDLPTDAHDALVFSLLQADGSSLRLARGRLWTTAERDDAGSAYLSACDPSLQALHTVTISIARTSAALAASVSLRVERQPAFFLARAYAGLCTMVRGVSPAYLAAWLDYHAAVGFGVAIVYVNEPWSTFLDRPGRAEHLARRIAEGRLILVSWEYPYKFASSRPSHFAQTTSMNACHRRFGGAAQHFAFTDVDEFIYVRANASSGLSKIHALLPNGGCTKLACTWGVAPAWGTVDLPGLLRANLTVVAPVYPFQSDHPARGRHKLFAATEALTSVGPHGQHSPGSCMELWGEEHLMKEVLSPDVAGFIHLLSPSISADPSAFSKSRDDLRNFYCFC